MDSRSRDRFVGRSFGSYKIEDRLGAGGMGIVYVARDERLRRTVALKMLRPGLAHDERRRKRFLREARYAAAIIHPNVVSVYEVGEIYGIAYMTMELVPGKSLREWILRGPLPIELAINVARDITRALARAHEHGIVHRDLKPDNVILYEPNPNVVTAKVLDFGLAKALEPPVSEHSSSDSMSFVTAAGVAVGTAGYMSPEQARGWPVDARSDIYAVGVLLHEMVTALRPQLVDADRAFTAPSFTNAKATRALDDLVFRCLARDPRKRFPNANALLAALDALRPAAARLSPRSSSQQAIAPPLALAKTSSVEVPIVRPTVSRRAAPTESALSGASLEVPLVRMRVPSLMLEAQPRSSSRSQSRGSAGSLRPVTSSRMLAPSSSRSPMFLFVAGALTMFAGCFAGLRMTSTALASNETHSAPSFPAPPPLPLPAASPPASHSPPPDPVPVMTTVAKRPTAPMVLARVTPIVPAPPSASASASALPLPDCTTPFVVDESGIRVVRRECLRR